MGKLEVQSVLSPSDHALHFMNINVPVEANRMCYTNTVQLEHYNNVVTKTKE